MGRRRVESAAPEARFLEQSLVFFVPFYVAALLFIVSVAAAERVFFGRRNAVVRVRPAFAAAFPALSWSPAAPDVVRGALRAAPGAGNAGRAAAGGDRPVRGGAALP